MSLGAPMQRYQVHIALGVTQQEEGLRLQEVPGHLRRKMNKNSRWNQSHRPISIGDRPDGDECYHHQQVL